MVFRIYTAVKRAPEMWRVLLVREERVTQVWRVYLAPFHAKRVLLVREERVVGVHC
jgi:hypothetical protein